MRRTDHRSHQITHALAQKLIAEIGVATGHSVWIAKGDGRRLVMGKPGHSPEPVGAGSLQELPVTGPPELIRTLEHVDVLWFRPNTTVPSMMFEVEHSTNIEGALLRLSDVLLTGREPAGGWQCRVVAPQARAPKFEEQLTRPVFRAVRVADCCRFLSYDELLAWHGSVKADTPQRAP